MLFFGLRDPRFSMNLGDKQITIGADEFLPINPQQNYGPALAIRERQVVVIFINKKFLNTLSASIYGKKEYNISFKKH